MRNKPILIIVFFVLILLCSCGGLYVAREGLNWLSDNGILTAPKVVSNFEFDVQMPNETVTPTLVAESRTPDTEATAIPTETAEAVPTSTLAPTETPFTGIVVNICPTASLGAYPDLKSTIHPEDELFFQLKPYGDGDPEVLCIFEAFSLTQDIKIIVLDGGANINADWLHGHKYNLNGELVDECQEKDMIAAPECEGTWVATKTYIIPKGNLVKIYVYAHENPAHIRFTQTISWTEPTPGSMAPFACEYIGKTFLTDDGRTIVHSEDSIRVPNWPGLEGGTIYEFTRTLPNPAHCPKGATP